MSKADTWVFSPPRTPRLQSEFGLEDCFCADLPFPDVLVAPSSAVFTLLFRFHRYYHEKTRLLLALTSLATASTVVLQRNGCVNGSGSRAGAQVSVYTCVSLNSPITLGFEHFPYHIYQVK